MGKQRIKSRVLPAGTYSGLGQPAGVPNGLFSSFSVEKILPDPEAANITESPLPGMWPV